MMRDTNGGPPVPDEVIELLNSQPGRDVILISQPITRMLHRQLSREVAANRQSNSCTVFLTTYGGDPDGGYRMARCLQHNYDHIRLVIPSFCKSAGTLVAIGAHELAIDDLGELGPLDIQVRKDSELEERSSGLDIMEAMEAAQVHAREAFMKTLIEVRRASRLSTRLAGEFAANVAIGVTAPLYNQIDPNRLGEMQRAMRIAHDYGQRLHEHTRSLQPGALNRLVAGYPAHGFVIDRKEAATLFTSVSRATAEEQRFIKLFWDHVFSEQSNFGPTFIRTNPSHPQGEHHDRTTENSAGEQEPEPESAGDQDGDGADSKGTDEQGERVRDDGAAAETVHGTPD
jgi:hypothetical protein